MEKTGRIIRKQKVAIKMSVEVTEYTTKEYRNRTTGARVHAPFPKGYVNEVNYDETVKAFQECTQHDCRYLIGSIQNEPKLVRNRRMQELFREMLHYRNGLGDGDALDEERVREFEERYDRILYKAEEGYTDNPPGDYYKEGYNLFLWLRKYKENELLFLHDKQVPANNSLCERLARIYKRKQKQAITLRSHNNLGYICDGLSIVYLLRAKSTGSVYREIADIYDRCRPPKMKAGKTDVNA